MLFCRRETLKFLDLKRHSQRFCKLRDFSRLKGWFEGILKIQSWFSRSVDSEWDDFSASEESNPMGVPEWSISLFVNASDVGSSQHQGERHRGLPQVRAIVTRLPRMMHTLWRSWESLERFARSLAETLRGGFMEATFHIWYIYNVSYFRQKSKGQIIANLLPSF